MIPAKLTMVDGRTVEVKQTGDGGYTAEFDDKRVYLSVVSTSPAKTPAKVFWGNLTPWD